jgi:hypothetical protein
MEESLFLSQEEDYSSSPHLPTGRKIPPGLERIFRMLIFGIGMKAHSYPTGNQQGKRCTKLVPGSSEYKHREDVFSLHRLKFLTLRLLIKEIMI